MTTFAQRIAIAAAAIAVIGTNAGCGEQMAEQIGGEIVDGQVEIDDDSISITDDEGNEFAADGYDAVLREQGFTLDQDSTIAGVVVRAYTGELHAVNLTLARIDGMTNVTVAVVPR